MMKKRVWIGFVLAGLPLAVQAQTVGGGGSIALPDIDIDQKTKFNPYAGKFDGSVTNTSDITGINKAILDTPRSVYSVAPKTLQEQMPQTLAEAVQTMPGTFIGNTNGGNSDFITIKGFEVNTSDSFLVGNDNGLLIDGIRAPTDRAFNANTQSIELLSGPASYLYGYAAEGGVLNVQRKLPLPDAHYSVDFLAGAVTGEVRDFAGAFDFTGPIYKSTEGVLAYRLVGSGAGNRPWREGDTTTRDFLMAPTFAWYSDVLTSTIAFEHGKNQQPYDRGDTSANGAPLAISPTVSYSEAFSQYNEQYDWVHGKTDYNLNKDNDFHIKYSYAATKQTFDELRSDNQGDFDPATGNINRYLYTNEPTGGSLTTQGYASLNGVHRAVFGPFKNEFQEGLDYYNANLSEQSEFFGSSQPGFNLYNPIYGQFNPGSLTNYGELLGYPLATQKEREVGVYAQDALTYDRFTATGSARYVSIYQYEKYFGGVDTNETEQKVLPSAALLYRLTNDTSVFADYSQSYIPNIYAIGQGVSTSFVGPSKPEIGIGYEAGIKSKLFNDKVLAQLSFYDINKDNVQTQNDTGVISDQAKERSEGLSLSVVGNVTPNINLNLAYNHQHAYVVNDLPNNNDIGAQLINAPSDIYTVLASYTFLNGPLNNLSMIAGVTGATKNAVDLQNSFFLPAYAIANIGWSYKWRRPNLPTVTVSFKVNNLFDSTYYPSTGSKTNWITVGEPRNYLLDINMAL